MVKHTFIIMPCYNEADYIEATCASLGYGEYLNYPAGASLILVNNASTDATESIANKIAKAHEPRVVSVVNEPFKGFVPARSAGVRFAAYLAKTLGVSQDECFIIQVDADSEYSPGYVKSFVEIASNLGCGNIFESLSQSIVPSQESESMGRYLKLINDFDLEFFNDLPDARLDYVVDDKCVGYFMSDYYECGGLKREFVNGVEFPFCGTTRLWMAMAVRGFGRHFVPDAVCKHSLRKISEGADIFVATAGWPRGRMWKNLWRQRNPVTSVDEFLSDTRGQKEECFDQRRKHLHTLFVGFEDQLKLVADKPVSDVEPANIIFKAFISSGILPQNDSHYL